VRLTMTNSSERGHSLANANSRGTARDRARPVRRDHDTATGGRDLRQRLQRREGALGFALNVSSMTMTPDAAVTTLEAVVDGRTVDALVTS